MTYKYVFFSYKIGERVIEQLSLIVNMAILDLLVIYQLPCLIYMYVYYFNDK